MVLESIDSDPCTGFVCESNKEAFDRSNGDVKEHVLNAFSWSSFGGGFRLKFKGRKICEWRRESPVEDGRWRHNELFETEDGKYIVFDHTDGEYHDRLDVDMDKSELAFKHNRLMMKAINNGLLDPDIANISINDFKKVMENRSSGGENDGREGT